MSLRSLQDKEKRIPRIVSDIVNDGVAVARVCSDSEEVVSGSTKDKGFSTPGSSTAADFLSFLDRFFNLRLRVGVESRGVWGRKSAVIVAGRK